MDTTGENVVAKKLAILHKLGYARRVCEVALAFLRLAEQKASEAQELPGGSPERIRAEVGAESFRSAFNFLVNVFPEAPDDADRERERDPRIALAEDEAAAAAAAAAGRLAPGGYA